MLAYGIGAPEFAFNTLIAVWAGRIVDCYDIEYGSFVPFIGFISNGSNKSFGIVFPDIEGVVNQHYEEVQTETTLGAWKGPVPLLGHLG